MNISEFMNRFEQKKQVLSYEKTLQKEANSLVSMKVEKPSFVKTESKKFFPKVSTIREDLVPKKKRVDRGLETKHQDLPTLYSVKFPSPDNAEEMILFIEALKIKNFYESKGFSIGIKDFSSANTEEGMNGNCTTYGKVIVVEDPDTFSNLPIG